jgi:hypothetical protein
MEKIAILTARTRKLNQLLHNLTLAIKALEAEVGPQNWLEMLIDVAHDIKWGRR